MDLKVLLPTQVLVDEEVRQVTAVAQNGSFSLLPRHIDYVTALVPSILTFVDASGEEAFLAIDEGILVKVGPSVLVSTRSGVRSPDLGHLEETIRSQFKRLDERERQTRVALARIEVDFVQRFLEL